jgi:glucose/arabinose dehydrogenase
MVRCLFRLEPYWRGIMARKPGISSIALAACTAGLLTLSPATAQQSAATAKGSDTKDELAQNFAAEHEIGRRYHFEPNDLPPPKTGPIVADRSMIVPFNGQKLEVPPGFMAEPFVTGLVNPRRLLVLPNGDVLVAEQSAGYLTLLRDDGEGRAKWINRHVEDLNRPYGLALRGDEILVPFLDTYRTMCLAPRPEFRRLLEQARDLPIAA